MPIYEYEPVNWDCLICNGRFEVLQSPNDEALSVCPTCGMDCRRVVSKAQIKVAKFHGHDHAATKGMTSYKKSGKGFWEKVAGEGVDAIVGSPEDIAAVEAESAPPVRKIVLDE